MKLVLAAIFLLGLILRLIQLDVSPPGFNADEAALGYNAYSLIRTGKDEWGEAFPLVFRSFSDYKPGLYVYLDIPFIALFGLNELAVRLPSIILGAFSIILVYFLSKEIFKKETVALSSSFLLAVSPWHLHYSRGAWETNVATFFILTGVLTFLRGLKNSVWFFPSFFFFIAAMYIYQSPRLVIPSLVVFLAIFYWKQLVVKKNIVLLTFATVLLVPLILIMSNISGLARFQGVSIFADTGLINRLNEERGQHINPQGFEAEFFHNKFLAYSVNFLTHYFDHFSPNFLFIQGDSLGRNKVPGVGQLYLFEIITLSLGLYFLIERKFDNSKVIFLWIFIAPLAAALTFQTPHALRAHSMLIPLNLISGLGLGILIGHVWQLRKVFRYSLLFSAVVVVIFFVSTYLHQYYIHLPQQYALEWEYGFSKLIPYILQNHQQYQKIVISDRYDQPYILWLFYSKYNPEKYQRTAKTIGDNKFGFTTITSFDKFEFRPISKEDIAEGQNTLFVSANEDNDQNITPLKTIDFPNGTPVFKIFGT